MTAVLPLVLPITAPVVLGGYSPWLSGQGGGVQTLRYIDGVLSILLADADGAPLTDADGAYLYEAY